jgi:hypothetical protein
MLSVPGCAPESDELTEALEPLQRSTSPLSDRLHPLGHTDLLADGGVTE